MTVAKQRIVNTAKKIDHHFIDILKGGDIDTLLCFLNEMETPKNACSKGRFSFLIQEWHKNVGVEIEISVSDLRIVYNFLYNTDITPIRLQCLLDNYNIIVNKVKGTKNLIDRVTKITWKSDVKPKDDIHNYKDIIEIPQQLGDNVCQPGRILN